MIKNEYNGYTNKPTWMFNTWVDEYRLRDQVMSRVVEIIKDREIKLHISAVYDYLKDEVLEYLLEERIRENTDPASFSGEVLGWGLAMINWGELARLYVSDAEMELGIPKVVQSVRY
tara:strand:+ start:113 stop:463 length:351 start_codon:yes stop_codon:yes gene_type:complete